MGNQPLATFREVHDLGEARSLAPKLEQLGFKPALSKPGPPAGEAIMGTGAVTYQVLLDRREFARAEEALETDNGGQADVPPDHYLLNFTDQELEDVVIKIDEWGPDDRRWARTILSDRGKPMSDDLVASMRQQRMDGLAQPAPPQHVLILLGYLLCLLGGVLSVAIGYLLNTLKKTLPNGERVYVYREQDRRHGKRIFFLGLAVSIPLAIIRIYVWIAGA